jgi:hypothetical protein
MALSATVTTLEGEMSFVVANSPASASAILVSMLSDLDASATEAIESITTGSLTPASQASASTVPPSAAASTTSGSPGAATGGAVATPTPFQLGMIGNCTKFHLVVSGDTCSSISTAAGINLSDFYTWNPAVGSSCATLFAQDNVCIGVGSYN